jgi:hemerythrin superfamily protein
MFGQFEKAGSAKQKENLAATICAELTLHAQVEETIFYPAVREAIEDEEIMNEADVEHGGAKELIAKIEACDSSDQHFDALVTVLGEAIKHHVKEEEGDMFKQVRRTDLDLQELGERMEAFKRDHAGAKKDRH